MNQATDNTSLLALQIFIDRLESLTSTVEAIAETNEHFYEHPSYKLLDNVNKMIHDVVPKNPNTREYNLGKTLDKLDKDSKGNSNNYTSWKRIKKHLPSRYRLFFKHQTTPDQSIIYAWLNDEKTLRKDGAKTDVYATFLRMLKSGTVPNSWAELEKAANDLPEVG
ncbi:type II toxin-antitoxin system YhaV family toxin [Vibrio breoganii]|uniref:type II toxin-antitoxin system YhaV family toxin n=1 Tax=Vibrio breoganii TaxID=553239 RepID=UPI0002F2C033|nr:type II toxin-antitoxin system YhaV family toxin [Vibrio breoganii]OEF82291.1 hypothetical protein B003_10775 [Vibrio breoganii 1C10]